MIVLRINNRGSEACHFNMLYEYLFYKDMNHLLHANSIKTAITQWMDKDLEFVQPVWSLKAKTGNNVEVVASSVTYEEVESYAALLQSDKHFASITLENLGVDKKRFSP